MASLANPGQPIAFQAASALTQDIKDLHTYGKVFNTTWVTLHDTDIDGFAPFNANALAKAAKATPFKRPENGQFRPGILVAGELLRGHTPHVRPSNTRSSA